MPALPRYLGSAFVCNLGLRLNPIYCQCPNGSWTDYTRGFDASDVNSSAIRSKNVTAHLTLQMSVAAIGLYPYQFRIIHGFTKFPTTGDIHSSIGTDEAYDGIMPNFTPSEKFQDNAMQTLGDAIGISNGNYNVRGNLRMDTVRVLSDKTVTFTAETVNAGGKVFYPSKSLNYHRATNKRMKLYPYVTGPDVTQYDGVRVTPANNPGLEIPFLAIICLNFAQYPNESDRPQFQIDWSHYWNNC